MSGKNFKENLANRSGFTLIEVIVVAAIIAILAGILTPMIFNQIDEAKKTKALGECKTISDAVLLFRKDTRKWPYYNPTDCTTTTAYSTLESGTGSQPEDLSIGEKWDFTRIGILGTILNLPSSGAAQTCYNNADSYFPEDKADPWGHKYIINSINFYSITDNPVWVLSAGPNGHIETSVNSQTLNADDIGVRIK